MEMLEIQELNLCSNINVVSLCLQKNAYIYFLLNCGFCEKGSF